jgi:predicted nucleic acid-binding Zn ribbon protein
MTEKPLKKCPACGKSVRRLIGTGIGILMKGASTGGSGSSCSLDGTCPTCCGPDQR